MGLWTIPLRFVNWTLVVVSASLQYLCIHLHACNSVLHVCVFFFYHLKFSDPNFYTPQLWSKLNNTQHLKVNLPFFVKLSKRRLLLEGTQQDADQEAALNLETFIWPCKDVFRCSVLCFDPIFCLLLCTRSKAITQWNGGRISSYRTCLENLSRRIFSKHSILTRFKSASALRPRLVHYQGKIQRGDDYSGACRLEQRGVIDETKY